MTELHCLGGRLYTFFHESTLLLRYCWRTFFQRGNAGDQQAYEKMLKITNHQESENQTTMSYQFTPVRMLLIKKNTNNKCCRGCEEKGTLVHCWWEYKLVQSLLKTW